MLPGTRAEHGVETALGERAGDHLGERREDGVLKLRHDQPDHAGAAHTQVGRTLVADHVERGQNGGAGRLGDPRAAVQYTADGGLADPGLLGNVCKFAEPRCNSTTILASFFPVLRQQLTGQPPRREHERERSEHRQVGDRDKDVRSGRCRAPAPAAAGCSDTAAGSQSAAVPSSDRSTADRRSSRTGTSAASRAGSAGSPRSHAGRS